MLTQRQRFHTSNSIAKCGTNRSQTSPVGLRKRQLRGRGDEGRQDVRQETIRIVREMREDDLDREGLYAFHGHGRLDRFIRWAYEHVRIHEDDIRKVLKKFA